MPFYLFIFASLLGVNGVSYSALVDRSGTADRILEAKEKQREEKKDKADRAKKRMKRYANLLPFDLSASCTLSAPF